MTVLDQIFADYQRDQLYPWPPITQLENVMKVTNNILLEAEHRTTPNKGGLIAPRIVVIHYTGDNSLSGALSWLCNRDAAVSAHLVIGRAGELYQLVPFNIRAWHAGKSAWNGNLNVNNFSIGIENVGTGKTWPAAQIAKLIEVLDAITEAYNIEDIVGHSEVATPEGRKADPGPRFPWDKITPRYFEV